VSFIVVKRLLGISIDIDILVLLILSLICRPRFACTMRTTLLFRRALLSLYTI
jgi:hypothetical protein